MDMKADTPDHDEGPSDDLLDPSVLDEMREMVGPDDDFVDRIISLFGEHAREALWRLQQACDGTDIEELADAAHAFKSLSRNVGAVRVGNLCCTMEQYARSGDGDAARCILPRVHPALDETLDAITGEMPDESGSKVA